MSLSEEWRPVDGFPGYEVGNLGNVRSWRPMGVGSPPAEPRLLKPRRHSGGYQRVSLARETKYHDGYIHRLVAFAFHGKPEPGQQVAHGNGIRTDNRADNLRWATSHENHMDKRLHGTDTGGSRNHMSRLTDQEAHEIFHATGRKMDIAAKYGISRAHVWQIKTGRRRAWSLTLNGDLK